MKSLTGKFTSVRGWALLLALLLGAGIMISACGDEEVPAPTAPAPTPTPTPTPTPEPEPEPEPTGPATPENLRVTATTSDSITWTWSAVDAVLGYQGQFSTDTTFTDSDPTFLIVAPATSHTVANLSGNMTGHFRVRSGAGTSLTDLTFSDWSDGAPGTTSAPPAAVALDAPGDLRTSDPEDDSIVLDWDEVDDADHYEVQQRVDGASSWSDATCGDGDNEVEDTTCIAGGLDEGTDYDFRVRGIPADDDDANTTGGWAETDGTTTGRAVVTTTGGTGDLNLTWKTGMVNETASIIWTWEPMSGVTYEWKVLEMYSDAANPCAGDTFEADTTTGAQFETSAAATPGQIKGLCLRTEDEDNRALSFAWGVGTPAGAMADQADATLRDGVVTTALTWETLALKEGFEYEIRVAADPQRDDDIDMDTVDKDLQAACTAGAFVDQGDTDVDFNLDEVTVRSGLAPYTGYLLCWRLANTAGASAWAVPNMNKELYTAPGRPATPAVDRGRTGDGDADNTTKIVWTVATRNQRAVPRLPPGFNAHTIEYRERWNDMTGTTPQLRTVPTPRVAACSAADQGALTLLNANWIRSDANITISSTAQGISISPPQFTQPAHQIAAEDLNDLRVHLCVQAKYAESDQGGAGPWVMSSGYEVRQQPAPE